jgi:hypothetical protein
MLNFLTVFFRNIESLGDRRLPNIKRAKDAKHVEGTACFF